ncbi:MerR family transcriptional regulator [Paenibacillus sp. KN14-4R]|uniref:MerR family transcriptional regulator n=1 Tax=Paenibacillus sp. KN14-4R TaxID=3445773 RepID=UPI003F9EFEB8
MNGYITIGELSKLMNVSVHQIRYFEEKEILFPAYIDSNQYRMYGITEIYQLSHILLLRKLNIPVSQIKSCMTSYSADDYHLLLDDSLQQIDSEINRLTALKQFIRKVQTEHQERGSNDNRYLIKQLDTRHLKIWMQLDIQEEIHARNLCEVKPPLSHLFETDLHYLYDTHQVTLCFEAAGSTEIMLEKGDYLYQQIEVTGDQEIEQAIHQFERYADEMRHAYLGPIIVVEKSYLSMFNTNKLHYEIQVRIH